MLTKSYIYSCKLSSHQQKTNSHEIISVNVIGNEENISNGHIFLIFFLSSIVFFLPTDLSSISGGENPHCSSTLFQIPKEPESRHLVGLRCYVHIDKQCSKLTNSA